MFKELDEIDKGMWHRVEENPGCCIRDAIRPFLLERSESVLRDRIRALALRQLIRLESTKREVRCYPFSEVVETEDGPMHKSCAEMV